MVDFKAVKAIDFHTHAEEPCNHGRYRERNIAAVIFPVDAERETGFRRYSNEEVAGICAENDDILIPFASIDPHKGKAGAREVKRLVRRGCHHAVPHRSDRRGFGHEGRYGDAVEILQPHASRRCGR